MRCHPSLPLCRLSPCWLLVAGMFLLSHQPALLQAQDNLAVLEVRVLSTGGEPLNRAQIIMPATGTTGWTDSRGWVRLSALVPGVQTVEIRSFGYATETFQVDLQRGWIQQWDVALEPQPLQLAEVRVDAEPDNSRQMDFLRGFYERKERGVGYFLTREDIMNHGSRDLSNILHSVPGLRATPSQFGQSRLDTRSSPTLGRPCQVRVYVDGMIYRRADDLPGISPLDIEGIEVYRGRSEIPAEFADPDANCGVVAIWSRRHRPGQPN